MIVEETDSTREPTPEELEHIEAFLARSLKRDKREPLGALEVRGVGWVLFCRRSPTPEDVHVPRHGDTSLPS